MKAFCQSCSVFA